ncbi:hypothetical protein ACQCX2_11310 [Propionibacteriaceae bacterium Y1700]|uniref:hypothetical protein n=1 Tax=Microlunatus sp. Y1700 TaxID=3418487 RepID=UPI003DA72104
MNDAEVRSNRSPGRPGIRAGSFLCAGAGLVWWIVAATNAPGAMIPLILLGLVCAITLIWFTRRHFADDGEQEIFHASRRTYTIVNIVQVVAIVLVILISNLLGKPQLIPGLITIVVGAHFFPLARAMRQPAYAKLAIAMIIIGALGLAYGIAAGVVDRPLIFVGMASAVALWAVPTSALLRQVVRSRPAISPFRLEREDDDSWGQTDEEIAAEREQALAEDHGYDEWADDEYPDDQMIGDDDRR